jgi:hypothetical protein
MVRWRGRSRWFAVPVLGFLGALALAGQGAAQSNGSSLTDPGEAARLARLPRRAPAMRCHDLSAAGSANLTILSDDVAGNRRDLCRVHAVIPAEIEFMLELPRAWNGRLYVLGNGGYGGESVTGDYALAERTRATELGFATLFTNLGHDRAREPGADWARGSLARKLDAEIRALARIYRGTFIDGRRVAPGVPVGAEAAGQVYAGAGFDPAPPESGWATRLAPDSHGAMQQRGNVEAWLRYLAFENDEPDMDITRFVPARDVPRLAFMSRILDAKDPDLDAFRARGGKLILYHGWADTGVNPLTTVRYFERVRDRMGTGVDSFARLYMVPGMFHCRGGLDVDRFDALAALIAWVERAEAPREIVASRMQVGRVVRTRPLCPFPQTAHYQGTGSADDARSFRCETPHR